jgi:GNAT superfamily N-acetyltransferase
MEIRPFKANDLDGVRDIDATVESSQYLHVERKGEGIATSWALAPRPLREKRTHRQGLDDEQALTFKQIALGAAEGIALVAEHDGAPVAAAAALHDPAAGILRLLDLRVDFDFRRQGLASALLFQIIQEGPRLEARALAANANADNFPALQFLTKLGFEPTGLDTHWRSNHDLVKESVVLFWYLTLD